MAGVSGAAVPRYFDPVIAAFRAGRAGRDVHLGYWATPPAGPIAPDEWERAQAALTTRMIEMMPAMDGARILDVGCGLGGTLAAIGARAATDLLVGINIDPRQLLLCRGAGFGNTPALAGADACALPFRPASFDQVFCIEAMFHFDSRAKFLAEARRVLRRGGILAVSDILIRPPPADAPWAQGVMAAALQRDYGPWPAVWTDADTLRRAATAAGLATAAWEDWSAQTRPSYAVTAPNAPRAPSACPSAGEVMRWLHERGWLNYVAAVFSAA